MFETVAHHPAPVFFDQRSNTPGYAGPERRSSWRSMDALLAHMLDETDHGMLLIGAGDEVLHSNHAARMTLEGGHPLVVREQELRAHQACDEAALHQALVGARRGRRRMLTLGSGGQQVSISVVPLASAAARSADEIHDHVLVVLGKRGVCAPLTLQAYARSIGLTGAETQVLELLCSGVTPNEIALQHRVAVCTVRTQIGSIRNKAQADSISDLVRQLALLPPLVTSLRGSPAMSTR